MMEPRVLLLCIVGCSLSRATPISMDNVNINASDPIPTNDSATTNETTADPDPVPFIDCTKKDLFDLIMEANKDIAVFLEGGDINYKRSRSAIQCPGCLWKKSANGTVQVPFTFPSVYTDFERSMVSEVMKEFEVMTCVKFVSRTTEVDYLAIESADGCWSYVGKVGGKQVVSISMPACTKYTLIQHELMHTLGFFHEQTRKDRDQYIKILWENISPSDYINFDYDGGSTLNLPYGYNSIMHYGSKDYSRVSGKPSMVVKGDPKRSLGQTTGMDDVDVLKVNAAYNCNLCRRKFVDETGTFTYNSKSSSQGASSCLYLIQTALKVLLQIGDFNISSSRLCSNSYIKVYDGVSQSYDGVSQTCGSGPVPPLVSSGSFMLIEIVNNQPSALSRFNASYQTVRYGGTFVTDNTVVTSPDFPNLYPNKLDIVYSIIAPKGYKVSLTFLFFWLQYSQSCSIDYLTIYDGPLKTSPILRTYCGYFLPLGSPLVSTGNVIVLQFHSGPVISYNGFYATIEFVPSK
ncbi:astacin-like metalloendopeptidase [Hyla sarda]|uniref:astacin-like metalloendopeptidase n=1 Tax=Hyla sarda TaxID=327740 RepID=UPI0024C2D857|nr:astacin-like metalloendopeptidase [Hyla sarda]